MRVQFTNEENKIIDERRAENKTSQDLVLPVELQGKEITLGFMVKDVHLFNAFIEQFLKDEKIPEQVGAQIIHVDYREPYKTENILFLQTWINNYINGMVFGPVPDQVENNEESSEVAGVEADNIPDDIEKDDAEQEDVDKNDIDDYGEEKEQEEDK